MNNILSDYYFALWELFVILFLVGAGAIVVYLGVSRRWRDKLEALEDELADCQAKKMPEAIVDLNQRGFLHSEFISGLDYIKNKGSETLNGLAKEQIGLRHKQDLIINKASRLLQRAENLLDVSKAAEDESKQMCNIKGLVQSVLDELYLFAQSRTVTLRPDLEDVEPIVLYRDSTLVALNNVIHNAIKYSLQGGVVEVKLSLANDEEGAGKRIRVDVKDTGKGIKKEDQERIFELHVREDGLLHPGSGLGLYLARKAARFQGGDVILVSSIVNQGSIFRIILPYGVD